MCLMGNVRGLGTYIPVPHDAFHVAVTDNKYPIETYMAD